MKKSLDINIINKSIIVLTKLSRHEREISIKWCIKQNCLVSLEIEKVKKSHFYKLKNTNLDVDTDLLSLSAYYLACHDVFSNNQKILKKNKNNDLRSVKTSVHIRAITLKKATVSKKHERMLNLKSIIVDLIEKEHLSFRLIEKYLQKNHNFQVSHQYISDFYKKTGKKKEKND